MTIRSGFVAVMARRYALWGRDVEINHPMRGDAINLRMIDATRGVEVGGDMMTLATVEPAALVRKSELTAARLLPSDLIGIAFTLNDARWRIQSTQPKPTVHGAESGEIVLMLSKACE